MKIKKRRIKNASGRFLLALSVFSFSVRLATGADVNQILTKPQESAAKRGNSYAKSNKAAKAQESYQTAIDQVTTVDQCLELVKDTQHYGSILVPVRRNCMNKALHIAKTQDEMFEIILCARQCQLYEITKEAIDSLIAKAQSNEDLLTLAHKAQGMAMNDVAHVAMEKMYVQTESLDDKISFAKQAKLMAMEDLMRRAIKDALDQESGAHNLCHLIVATEPLEQQDLERKILRKAVYEVKTPEDCKEVFDLAKRFGEQDIVELAAYKGRKMILTKQALNEQADVQEQIRQQTLSDEQKQAEAEAKALQNQVIQNQNAKTIVPVGPGF